MRIAAPRLSLGWNNAEVLGSGRDSRTLVVDRHLEFGRCAEIGDLPSGIKAFLDSRIGTQYRRISLPIGVPGPVPTSVSAISLFIAVQLSLRLCPLNGTTV